MIRQNLISDYQIFFDLRDNYPDYCEVISEIMRYAFNHQDTFCECTYLNGILDVDVVKFIFENLGLELNVLNVMTATLRSVPYTIVELSFKDE